MTRTEFNWENSIAWSGPGTIEGVKDTLAGDRLDRARYAEFLTNYLAAEGKQRNYVLNLNAEWGAGKTWFIKRWYMELKQHYPTVYIDAWQQDFSDDPLLTVISSIIEQLRDAAGNKLAVPDGIKFKLLGLLKVGGKLVLKSAIKKAGLEDGDFSMEGEDADKLVDTLCSNHKERYESIQYLKQEIRQWVEAAVSANLDQLDGQGRLDYPAFILIDELDRCRPSYAVEMLETIKHIFDIKGVVFVLATDTEQLQHAIKVIYGLDFDAHTYLNRFFIRRFSLLAGSRYNFIESYLSESNGMADYSFDSVWPKGLNINTITMVFSSIADACKLSLRSTEKFIDRMILVLLNLDEDVNVAFLAYLIALHEVSPSDYEMIISMVRNRQKLENVKMQNINPRALNELQGSINISMNAVEGIEFVNGYYSISLEKIIRDYLWSYLGEHENALRQLKEQNKIIIDRHPRITNEEHSEMLKYYVLNVILYDKSRLDMSAYRDWVELAISFE